jgi:hypothetical protein
VLIVSTMIVPELNEYPNTGQAWGRNYEPGPDAVDLRGQPD